MYDPKSRALNIYFEEKSCFFEICVMYKMRAVPFQNQGHKGKVPKQSICFIVSGPFPPTVEDLRYSLPPSEHQHLEPRAQRGIYVGNAESRRGFKLILDGKRKTLVTYYVAVYEQTLIDAIYSALQNTSDEVSTIPSNPEIRANTKSSQSQFLSQIKTYKRTAQQTQYHQLHSTNPATNQNQPKRHIY